MTDENKQRLQEEQEDAALGLLMNEYAEIEGAALWQKFQAAEAAGNGPSTPHREDRELSRRSEGTCRRINFLKRLGKGSKRAAVIALVLVCMLSPMVLSTEAFKIPVLNYIVAIEQKFSGFNFGKNDALNQEQEQIIDLILSALCPEGYRFAKQEVTPNGRIWLYFEYEDRIAMTISVYPSKGQINIDTEDIQQIPMEIQGYDAVYLPKEGHRLMWMDADRELLFNVYASELGEEDFWRYVYVLIAYLSL